MFSSLIYRFAETLPTGSTYSYSSTDSGSSSAFLFLLLAVYIPLIVLIIVSLWKIFAKAGRPGWASLVPIYNTWVLFEMAGKPGWWALLALVPFVNIAVFVLLILAYLEIAERFGKSTGFGILMVLLPFIAFPILAFGKATYSANNTDNAPTYSPPQTNGSTPPSDPGQPQPPAPASFSPAPAYQPAVVVPGPVSPPSPMPTPNSVQTQQPLAQPTNAGYEGQATPAEPAQPQQAPPNNPLQ